MNILRIFGSTRSYQTSWVDVYADEVKNDQSQSDVVDSSNDSIMLEYSPQVNRMINSLGVSILTGTLLGGIGGWRMGVLHANQVITAGKYETQLSSVKSRYAFVGKSGLIFGAKYALVGSGFLSMFSCLYEGARVGLIQLHTSRTHESIDDIDSFSARYRDAIDRHADSISSVFATQVTGIVFGLCFFRKVGFSSIFSISSICSMATLLLVSGEKYLQQNLIPQLEEKVEKYK